VEKLVTILILVGMTVSGAGCSVDGTLALLESGGWGLARIC
jgi:hypothetical protein